MRGGYLDATIPSFGPDHSGPDGHLEGNVRPERVDRHHGLGPDYRGPVPEPDLAVDADDDLVEGHLCMASFDWWTERFAQAGFIRCVEVEERLFADIEPAEPAPYRNLYRFRTDDADPSVVEPRSPGRTLADLGLSHRLIGTWALGPRQWGVRPGEPLPPGTVRRTGCNPSRAGGHR